MAKDKERSVNPAQQQRKLEKAKALKKGKAELQAKRNEKLAKRNPDRIQRQIEDLKALETAGDIKPREKAILADLERDLKAVRKAREALGQKAPLARPTQAGPRDGGGRQDGGVLGKRNHDGQRKFDSRREQSGSDTDESVRNLPWPRDTPPPISREYRRNKNANMEPLGEGRLHLLPAKPAEVKTTYESAPQIRDLKKEAVSRFVPNVVKRKQEAVRGTTGQLLEPEEYDRLEKEGYIQSGALQNQDQPSEPPRQNRQSTQASAIDSEELRRLRAEEEAFERELAIQDGDQEEPAQPQSEDNTPLENTTIQAGARLVPSRQVEMEEVDDDEL